MKRESVHTSIDLPRDLHRRLSQAAARKGCSERQLILRIIERAVKEAAVLRPSRRLTLDPPLVPATRRRRFELRNEQIYDLIEFP